MKTLSHWLAVLVLAFSAAAWAGPYSNLYVLGDSLSDSGNILLASANLSFLPIKPIPGAPYFQGRASNGPVAVEVLAQQLGLGLTPSLAGGNNFAYGGARTDTHAFEVFAPQLFPGQNIDVDFDVLAQLAQFNTANPVVDPNALYVVFAGANNLQDAVRAAAIAAAAEPIAANRPAVVQTVLQGAIVNAVGDLGAVLGTLISRGARNFLVPNAPNLAVVPRIQEENNPQLLQIATQATIAFNTALEGLLASFPNQNMIGFDLFGLLQQVVADPTAFGLTNTTLRCYTGDDSLFTGGGSVCPNADEFLFWDGIHPTAAVHSLLGNRLAAAVAVAEPPMLALCGVVLFGWALRRGR